MGCFRLKESFGIVRMLACAAIGALGLSAWAGVSGNVNPVWESGSWKESGFTPAANNVFYKYSGTKWYDGTAAGDYQFSAKGNFSYTLKTAANITEIRFYSEGTYCEANIDHVTFTDVAGDTVVVDTPVVYKSPDQYSYSYLKRPDGGLLCADVKSIKLELGNTTFNWIDEIEAISDSAQDGSTFLMVASTLPGIGAPSPSYGALNALAEGDEVSVSAGETEILTEDGLKYMCTGWNLYEWENEAYVLKESSSDANKFSFTYKHGAKKARLVWQWECRYRVSVSAGEGGTVEPTEEVYLLEGERVDVKAVAGAGQRFKCWTGDVTAGLEASESFSLLMGTSAVALNAEFCGTTEGVTEVGSITDLAGALASAQAGDVIVLKEGEYPLAATLVIDKPVVVRGETGNPEDVVLDAGGACRAVQLSNGAVLENVSVKNGKLTSNANGAGVLISSGVLRNCVVSGCSGTNGKGAGVALGGAGCIVENCVVSGCTSTTGSSGTGVYNNGGLVRQTRICNNTESGSDCYGVGFCQEGAAALCDACVITNNLRDGSLSFGGRCSGACIYGGEIRSSVIAFNGSKDNMDSGNGALVCGLYVKSARAVNCTIAYNWINNTAECAGIRTADAASIVENCLIFGNYNRNRSSGLKTKIDDVRSGDVGTWLYNVVKDHEKLLVGETNMEAGEEPFKGDGFDIADGSVSIGTGMVEPWMASAVDAEGLPRLRTSHGNPVVDIGALAYKSAGIVATISSDSDRVQFDSLHAVVVSDLDGDLDGLTYYWDTDGDGSADLIGTDLGTIEVDKSEFGTYSVTLYVTNGVGVSAKTDKIDFTVVPQYIYFDSNSADPQWPYNLPGHAAKTLTDAVSVSELANGITIRVASGTNAVKTAVTLTTATTVEPADPTKISALKGDSSHGGMFNVSGKEPCVIRGLTFINGAQPVQLKGGSLVENCTFIASYLGFWKAGGSVVCSDSTVRNCIFRDATMKGSDSPNGVSQIGGLGISVSGNSLVERCVFDNLVIKDSHPCGGFGPYGAAIQQSGGTVRNCLIRNCQLTLSASAKETSTRAATTAGVMMSGGKLVNCTIVSNRTDGTSGGLYVHKPDAGLSAIAKNCIIWGNTTDDTVPDWAGANGADARISYCCTTPALSDEHSIAEDPMFKNPELLDGVISAFSPCARTGVYDAAALGDAPLDLYGEKLRTPGGKLPMGCVSVPSPGLILMIR